MTRPTPEQVAAVDWLDDPTLPTPSAEEAVRRFREAGIRSDMHGRVVRDKVRADRRPPEPGRRGEMADTVTAGGKPSKGTPADKRIKENKPKK